MFRNWKNKEYNIDMLMELVQTPEVEQGSAKLGKLDKETCKHLITFKKAQEIFARTWAKIRIIETAI